MNPRVLQDNFDREIFRDSARDDLPPGSVWDLVNWLTDLDAPLTKRGGWTYESVAPGAATGGTYYMAGVHAPFAAGSQIVTITDTGEVVKNEAASAADKGDARVPWTKIPYYRDLVIVPGHFGENVTVKKYNGTTVADLAGTPPNAHLIARWKSYLLLARTDAQSNRIWVSGINNPEVWNTADPGGAWATVSLPITGLAPLGGVLLAFQEDRCSRFRGDTPPPGGDWVRDDPVFMVGCSDSRSIAYYKDQVIWANPQGIFMSDGSTPSDLTKAAGASLYWQALMKSGGGYIPPATPGPTGMRTNPWVISGEVFRGRYIVTIHQATTGAPHVYDTLSFDLERKTWSRLDNIDGWAFFPALEGQEDVFLAHSYQERIIRLAPMWNPTSANREDGNTAPIDAVLETPFYTLGKPGLKRIQNVYLTYDARSTGGAVNAAIEVSYELTPEGSTYTSQVGSPDFLKVGAYTRGRGAVNERAHGIGLKIVHGSLLDSVRLYKLEADHRPLEGSMRS